MSRFIVHWLVIAIALAAVARILPGVEISSWPALLVVVAVGARTRSAAPPSTGTPWDEEPRTRGQPR